MAASKRRRRIDRPMDMEAETVFMVEDRFPLNDSRPP
jgi:hypothetical protein